SARKETAVYCGGSRRPELCFSRTSTFLRVVMRRGKMQATGRFHIERLILFSLISLTLTRSGIAQDPFEIQVYEYETVPKRKWNLETHLNYVARGTKTFEGTVAPSQHQLHLTYELTRGLTSRFELAGYLVLA